MILHDITGYEVITAETICVFQWIQTKIILSTSAMSRLHIKRRYYGDTEIAAAGFKYSAHSNAPVQVLTSKNDPHLVIPTHRCKERIEATCRRG